MVVSILQALCVLAAIYYAWRIAASYFGRYSRIAGIDRWQVRAGVCRCPRQSVWSTLRQDLIKHTTCCTINNRAVAPHNVYSFFKSYVYPKAICVDRGAVIVKRACVVRSTYITLPGWPAVRRPPRPGRRLVHVIVSLASIVIYGFLTLKRKEFSQNLRLKEPFMYLFISTCIIIYINP